MERQRRTTQFGRTIIGSMAVVLLLVMTTACSSDQPKPMAQPSPEQVRGHADHTFDKLKQEERERAAQPPSP